MDGLDLQGRKAQLGKLLGFLTEVVKTDSEYGLTMLDIVKTQSREDTLMVCPEFGIQIMLMKNDIAELLKNLIPYTIPGLLWGRLLLRGGALTHWRVVRG